MKQESAQPMPAPVYLSQENTPRDRSSSVESHRKLAATDVRCFVITVSDTRTEATDEGGALIRRLVAESGHSVVGYQLVPDDKSLINEAVRAARNGDTDPEAIVVTGGSGIGPRDVTPEALLPMVTRVIPGFGELFRMLSYAEIGPAAMLSRAFAGLLGHTLLYVLPGSKHAVGLAMEQLVLPELGHFVSELRPERKHLPN